MPGDEHPEIRVEVTKPRIGDFVRPLYANNINMNHTPHDFRLVFSQISVPLEDPKGGVVEIVPEAVADIRLPASVMFSFVRVVEEQFNRYIESYGPPNMSPEGPGR